MQPTVLRLKQPPIAEKALFQLLKMPADDEEYSGPIRTMLQEAAGVAVPKGGYVLCQITEKGEDYVIAEQVRLDSPLVRRNLENTDRIVPFVATCGTELEEWSQRYIDPLEAYWADGIKLLYLHEVRKALAEEIRRQYFPVGDMSAMSPGSLPAWPLPAQKPLLSLLGGAVEETGVVLTESFLMQPSKSSSGFFFSAQRHYVNCTYCPMPHCPNRGAPFEGELPNHEKEAAPRR